MTHHFRRQHPAEIHKGREATTGDIERWAWIELLAELVALDPPQLPAVSHPRWRIWGGWVSTDVETRPLARRAHVCHLCPIIRWHLARGNGPGTIGARLHMDAGRVSEHIREHGLGEPA